MWIIIIDSLSKACVPNILIYHMSFTMLPKIIYRCLCASIFCILVRTNSLVVRIGHQVYESTCGLMGFYCLSKENDVYCWERPKTKQTYQEATGVKLNPLMQTACCGQHGNY